MALKKCNFPAEPLFGLPEISSGQVLTNNRSPATKRINDFIVDAADRLYMLSFNFI